MSDHDPALIERFWSKVDRSGECWLWLASRNQSGYGLFSIKHRSVLAHRTAYELLTGPIPEGLQLDHLCRVRHCVNPHHLEPVTNRENTLRGDAPRLSRERAAERTHCKHNHEFTPANTAMVTDARGREFRRCRTCDRTRARARRERIACPTCGTEMWPQNLALHATRRHADV